MKFTAGVLADGTVTSHAQRSTEWANKKAAGILALRPPGSKLAGFEIAAAAPVLSTLSKFSRCVESEILFLDRNTLRVAEQKHVTERDGY